MTRRDPTPEERMMWNKYIKNWEEERPMLLTQRKKFEFMRDEELDMLIKQQKESCNAQIRAINAALQQGDLTAGKYDYWLKHGINPEEQTDETKKGEE